LSPAYPARRAIRCWRTASSGDRRFVCAAIAEVWRAYTTPADICQWNAASDDWHTTTARVDLREGGDGSVTAGQIADWVQERHADAELVQGDGALADFYRRWQGSGDMQAAQRLQAHLEQLRQSRGLVAVSLLDTRGDILWSAGEAPSELAPALRQAASLAAADGRGRQAGPYLGLAGRPRLDFLAPLAALPRPAPLVVFHYSPADWLQTTLEAWPARRESGEAELIRREGDDIHYLSALRHRPEAMLSLRQPLATEDLLEARLLRGEDRQGAGLDYRGVPVFGVLRAVPGTDWHLVAKVDRAEIYGQVAGHVLWVSLATLFALFLVAAGMTLLRQRQALAFGEAIRDSQAERLRALSLLEAVADGSEDAIFAKDLEGRYVLFNRAAARIVGKPAADVLGKDDRAIFPPDQAAMLMEVGRRVVAEDRSTQEEVLDTPDGRRTFLATKSPLRDGEGRVVGTFGISRDITEQKRIEVSLRQEWRLRQRYLDTMQTIMIALDLEGRITMVNRAACQLLGRPEEQLLGRDWFATCLPEEDVRPRMFEVFCQILGGRLQEFEVQEHPVLCRDGSRRLVAWHNNYLTDEAGQIVGTLSAGEDITDRRHAEASLDESEGRFRALVEQSLAGIYIIQAGHFRYVNPGFAAIFGYDSPDALIDRVPVAELVAPGDRQRVADNIQKRVAGEVADMHYSFRGLRLDGSQIDVEVHGRRFDYQGQPAVIGLVLDITARKAAEDSLRASELRFHDIVNASADWVWEVDAEGRYTYVSDSVVDLLGYTPGEVLGRTPFDLMPPEEAERVRAQFAEVAARRAPFRDLDNINRHKDGSLRHVQTNGMPVLDEAGNLLGYRGLDRDVTEKRHAELALLETSNRLRALVRTIPDLVWLKDPQGIYLACNPRFEDFFGAREKEIVGKSDYDFVSRELADFFRAKDQAAIAAGKPSVNEEEIPFASDGHREVLQTIKTPIYGSEGELIGVLGIGRDITARKRAEEALQQQTEELRARNEQLERFNRAMVGRELDMIELKRQVNELSRQLGRVPPFDLGFADALAARREGERQP